LFIISSKQSNDRFLLPRGRGSLFLSLITAISIAFTSNVFSQSLSGGIGGGGSAAGGASTATSTGGTGGTASPIDGWGGGGGGGGITGGAGGAGGGGASGGSGGIPSGGTGGGGSGGSSFGGGGGGGGAAGIVINAASATNNATVTGGTGGAGGGSSDGGGGGGGAGGYGAIITSGTTTNNGSILGGAGGAGGDSFAAFVNADGGSGGVGVYLSGTSNLVNSGTVSGGVGGAAGAGGFGGTTGSSAPGVYVASGSTSTINNTGTITGGTGIQNAGTISALNNAQAGLTYTGILPSSYNIIVNSAASTFGTLNAGTVTGSTIFGIALGSNLAAGTYNNVLQNIGNGNGSVNSSYLSGAYGGNYSWNLVQWDPGYWNLVVAALNNSGGTSGGGTSGGDGSSSGTSANSGTVTYVGNNAILSGSMRNIVIYSNNISNNNFQNQYNNFNINNINSNIYNINSNIYNIIISINSLITGDNALINNGVTNYINNYGLIYGLNYGFINNIDSTIYNLYNNGIISGGVAGIANLSPNTIQLLVNTGTILGGIDNTQGRIITLQNAQGGAIPLALSGNLPNNYQVIVNGLSSYGQLAVTKAAGQMTFGIAAGSVVYTGLTYTSVLTGVGVNNLLNTAGSSGGYLFKLTPETSGTVWNMTIGASVADTQSSLQSTTSSLQTQYALQSNGVIAGLTYDCSLFGENGICISAGGRQTGSSSFINGTTSALLIGAYKVNDKIRVGAYLDQNLSASNPNGIISNSNSTPMGGLFAVWNDRNDGLGTEVKASLGYNNKGMTITRPVVGTSEPGSGSTALTSQGANVVAKFIFGIDNRTTLSPYVGARYLSTVMNGYSEGQASNVLVPLAYSSLSMNATTALAGVGANHRLDEEITLSASVGMEADVQTTNGSYTVTNVNGLTPVALNPNPNKVRPTATAAAYYKLHKDAQIGLSVLYRQDSMTGMSSTTGMVTYTMGM
jgi:hypothetical protein